MAEAPIVFGTNRARGQRPCEWCGEAFWWHPKMRVRFCSNKCASASRCYSGVASPLPWVQCPDCSAWYLARGSRQCPSRCRSVRRIAKQRARQRAKYVPAVERNPVVTLACAQCGKAFESRTYSSRRLFCSEKCSTKEERRTSRARRRLRGVSVQRVYRRRIFERDGWRCRLCGKTVKRTAMVPHPLAPTLDHIVPLAAGGRHEPANVQCAHFLCNSVKSAGTGPNGDQLRLLG